jgi:hypothetical protein
VGAIVWALGDRNMIGEKGGVHVTGLVAPRAAKCWFVTKNRYTTEMEGNMFLRSRGMDDIWEAAVKSCRA